MLEERITQLENKVQELESRNKRVEANKSWETSPIRILIVAALTYSVMLLVFWQIGGGRPFEQAIIPTIGFVLSTLSLTWINKLIKKFL